MSRFAAGIVLYEPDIDRLNENINSIILQVDHIILVDNNSSNINTIENEYRNNSQIILIKNKQNMGIAKALNQIIFYCKQKKYEWVLTLDQDSVCDYGLIENYKKYINMNDIGIMTPRIIDRNYIHDNKNSNIESTYIDKCITSGSFMNVKICEKIGGFDEKMFIDIVDFEYCMRLRKAGYKILKLNNVTLLHQLGNLQVYKIFGKEIRVTNHSVKRNYYYSRNAVYYYNKHKDFISKKQLILILVKKILKIIFFEKEKNQKIRVICVGIKDGLNMK